MLGFAYFFERFFSEFPIHANGDFNVGTCNHLVYAHATRICFTVLCFESKCIFSVVFDHTFCLVDFDSVLFAVDCRSELHNNYLI